MDQNINSKTDDRKQLTKTSIAFIVVSCFLALALGGVVAGFLFMNKRSESLGTRLEYVYQNSLSNLSDAIDNAEIRMSKLAVSSDGEYQAKLVSGICENSKSAQDSLSFLPSSIGDLNDTMSFFNKLYGYMTTCEDSIEQNGKLTKAEKSKIQELHETLKKMKEHVTSVVSRVHSGYSMLENSELDSNGESDFSSNFSPISQDSGSDIPSMIYDGPFADSVLNPEIKGLNGKDVDEKIAREKLLEIFDGQDVRNLSFDGEAKGKFHCFNFSFDKGEKTYYASMTKKGGHLLTLNAQGNNDSVNFSPSEAKNSAISFLKKASFSGLEVVWSDEVGGDMFLNFAPIVSNIILYPDLIKVKVDLSTNEVIGFEASLYFTHHTSRALEEATFPSLSAKEKIPSGFSISSTKLSLCPLDFNREVLCYELKCIKNGEIYYFYYNALSGVEENILKVVETDNGNLLM